MVSPLLSRKLKRRILEMTQADIRMVKAMLVLIRNNAEKNNEKETVEQLDSVISVLDDKIKGSEEK